MLQMVSSYKLSMSVKKHIHSLNRLCFIYDVVTENLLSETDLDSYFYHDCSNYSLSHHGLFKSLDVKTKTNLPSKFFDSAIKKNQQGFFLKKERSISKRKTVLFLGKMRDGLRLMNTPKNPNRFLYRNSKLKPAPY